MTERDSDERDEDAAPAGKLRVLDSQDLFGNAIEIGIAHAGLIYRLRITRQGKLILNK